MSDFILPNEKHNTFMKKLFTLLLFGTLMVPLVSAQTGTNCLQAFPFCTGTNYTFTNSTGVPSLGTISCLGTTPNPVWYYMQVENTGSIDITMVQTSGGGGALDVDFAVWGPFPSLAAGCGNPFPPGTPVDCSYSTANVETANIPNAPAGQFYILLITNFSNQAGTITFSQSGGVGSTDCGILSNADNNGPLCEGETLILNGDVQNAPNTSIEWYHMPDFVTVIGTSQTLTIAPATLADGGDYAFVAINNNTFESDTSFTTVEVFPIPPPPTFTSTAPACEGSTITLTPDVIVPGATYQWTGSPNGFTSNQAVPTFANAIPAIFNSDYSLVVTINGCVSPPYTQNLTVYDTNVPVVTGPTEVCEGAFVPLDVTNGNLFVSFSWNSVAGGDPQLVPNGSYTVSATDANGCVTTSTPAHVIDLIPNPLDITGPTTFCEGTPITINATPGKQSYTWSTGSSQESTQVSNEGLVIVQVVSMDGCNRSDSVFISMYDKPIALFNPAKICDGVAVNFQNVTQLSDTHGSVEDSWNWNFDDGSAASTDEEPTHTFPGPGTYMVNFQVETNNGCLDTLVFPFLVIEPAHPNFTFESFCFGEGKFTNVTAQGTYPAQSTMWDFGDGSAVASNSDPELYHGFPSIATYSVTLTVTDTAGCISDTTMDVTLKNTPMFDDIPNVITPNGDGVNDDYAFIPEVGDCYNYTFAVFNRWGAKVFETEGAGTKPFNGVSNLGSKLQDGVYYWVLIANGVGQGEDEHITKRGSITVAGTK